MDNSNKHKLHRNNDKVISLYALSSLSCRQLPLSTLKGLRPMEHCALNKGEFITVSEEFDRCVTARGKVFSDDDPDSIIAGYDYNYEMVAYEDGEIELTSETKNTFPAPRSRRNIGVGEVVTIKSNVGVTWRIDSKLVSIIKREAKELCIRARDKGGICTITASYKRKGKTIKNSITFTIVEPKMLRYSLAKYQDYKPLEGKGSMLYHSKGTYEGLVGLRIQLLPISVNFSNVLVRELNCASVNTGYFKDASKGPNCHIHIPGDTQCTGNGEEVNFKAIGNTINIANTFDIVGGGDNDPKADIGNGGSMKLTIPLEWRLDKSANWKSMGSVKQDIVLWANGNITISKGNFNRTFTKNDDYPDRSFVDHNPKNKI
ncbi:hypothetical protein [Snodgrassella sp. ESL0253]|uniref:hypothetical protein n=1 Tax=Snodgrassella sp. ESL0253 TaxID=2705031 RepID=UPI001581E844|nr:hypothetical protein [Snodgrassella sp. ESL0253]NUE66909.1 hypothetical protein [Snodgrassella sp. ESL0253]